MVRFVIIGIVIAVAFTLYALVDAAMTDGSRARGVGKPVWVVLIVVLPVIGGALWFMIGKGSAAEARRRAADDDPRFTGTRISHDDLDARMHDLEEQLRALDDEVYPGEDQQTPTSGRLPEAPGSSRPRSGNVARGEDSADSDFLGEDQQTPTSGRLPEAPGSSDPDTDTDPGFDADAASPDVRNEDQPQAGDAVEEPGSDDSESPKR